MEIFSYCCRDPQNSVAESDIRHRFHHVAQIQLVAPFLFNVDYESEHAQRWMREAGLLPLTKCCDDEFVDVVKSRVKLCVKVYTVLIRQSKGEPIVSTNQQMVVNTLKWLNKCRPTLDQLIFKLQSDWKWMREICDEVGYGSVKEVLAMILTALHITMTKDKLIETYDRRCADDDKDIEWFLKDGNERLQNNYIQGAIESYSHGLNAHHYSSELYLGRSQAYMQEKNYKKAELDAIRSIFLHCDLIKGYYLLLSAMEKQERLSEAYYVAKRIMIKLNVTEDANFVKLKDLFDSIKEKVESMGFEMEKKFVDEDKDPNLMSDTSGEESDFENVMEEILVSIKSDGDKVEKLPEDDVLFIETHENCMEVKDSVDIKLPVDEKKPKNSKTVRKASTPSENEDVKTHKEESRSVLTKDSWRNMVFEASTNLVNQHFKLASQLYAEVLKYFRENPNQESVKEKEIVIIKYAYGISCIETRNQEEMLNSIAIFEEILEKHSKIMFPLVYYGLTYSYFKQNRFKEALQIAKTGLENSKNMMIQPMNWPQIDKNIPESATGKFRPELEKLIDICQSPPPPDAICRYPKCSGHFKCEIYLTDPDCKGFIKVTCDEGCSLQYHNNCWKNIKDEIKVFNDKEFLETSCLTPDCPGGIMEVVHIDPKGEVAKRFKSTRWNKGGYTKQKRPRSSKKLSHKDKKKKKIDELTHDDNNKQEDDEPTQELESFESIAATIFDAKPNREPTPPRLPLFPENVAYTVIKKTNEPEEPKKIERHRKKEKKKQVLKLNEFFADEEEEDNGQLDIGIIQSKRKRKKRHNSQNGEIETSSRHSSESDHTSSLSRDMGDEDLAAASGESLLNENIKKTLFDCMKTFFKQNGQLRTDDIHLIEQLALLPIEIQEFVADIGGIREFLKKFDEFVVYDNVICLTEHFRGVTFSEEPTIRCKSVGESACSMLDTITECSEPPVADDVSWIEAKRKKNSKKVKQNDGKWGNLEGEENEQRNLYNWVPVPPQSVEEPENGDGEAAREGRGDLARNENENVETPSHHYTNLQKLWKFVSKLTDTGQGQMLRLMLKLIIRERILERFSPNPENVDRAKMTFKSAIVALSNTQECEVQTDDCLMVELQSLTSQNEELRKQVKEHEDLIAYLLSTKRQKWEEEKQELEKKLELMSNNMKMAEQAIKESESERAKLQLEFDKLKEKEVNVRPVRSADAHNYYGGVKDETRCSSAPNSTRSRERVAGQTQQTLMQPYSVNPSGKTSIPPLMPPAATPQQGNPKNSYEKLLNALETSFPSIDREELKSYVQQLRSHCSNRLSGLTIDQIVKEVSNMIRMKNAPRKATPGQPVPIIGGMGLERITQPGNAWSRVKTKLYDWKNPEEVEEPCVICHEELKEMHKLCTLQCNHRFHESCIKAWFKQESTCPTCRAHSLLPDEFPCLS